MSGPTSVSGSSGWPTRIFALRAFSLASKSSAMLSCTRSREDEVQRSPFSE
jgi:hypothetical protein